MVDKVLIIETNAKLEAIYSLNLKMYVGIDCELKRSAQFAIDSLLKNPDMDIKAIITRATIREERSALLLYQYLLSAKKDIPLIVIGSEPKLVGLVTFLEAKVDVKKLVFSVAYALNITAGQMIGRNTEEFIPIKAIHITLLTNTICDIYIKIKRKGKEDQYIKRLFPGELFTKEEITSYIEAGLEFFYVTAHERLKFTSYITKVVIRQLSDDDLTEKDRLIVGQISMELMGTNIEYLGLNAETIDLARATMKSVALIANRYPEISKLVKIMMENRAGYFYQHVQLLVLIGQQVVRQLEWKSRDSEDQFTFVAFFHDVAFTNEQLCKISSEEELKEANLSPRDKDLVNKHAQLSAEIVHHFPQVPMSAHVIIRQHHGSLNGLGFEGPYGGNLSPMSVVFILCEELTNIILASEFRSLSKRNVIDQLYAKYPTARFKKIIDLMENILF